MILVRLISILFVFSLVACDARNPNCASNETITLVSQSIAEKIIDIGVENFKTEDLSKRIRITDIQTESYDEKLDTYVCNGIYSIEYPSNLSKNIFNSYSSEEGRAKVLEILKAHYGEIPAYLLHGQVIATLSIATIGATLNQYFSPNEKNTGKPSLSDALNYFLTDKNKANVSYKIYSIKNTKEKNKFIIKSTVEDDTTLEVIKLFLNISIAYN